jgi:hypothetical protein
MVVDTGGRIPTIRSMSLSRGSLPATIAAAVAARADVTKRVTLSGCGESFLACGSILEHADLSWLRE